MVPIQKSPLQGLAKAIIRVCGDYSVAVSAQLEDHRQTIHLPEDLMRKLGRGYGFIKIYLVQCFSIIFFCNPKLFKNPICKPIISSLWVTDHKPLVTLFAPIKVLPQWL